MTLLLLYLLALLDGVLCGLRTAMGRTPGLARAGITRARPFEIGGRAGGEHARPERAAVCGAGLRPQWRAATRPGSFSRADAADFSAVCGAGPGESRLARDSFHGYSKRVERFSVGAAFRDSPPNGDRGGSSRVQPERTLGNTHTRNFHSMFDVVAGVRRKSLDGKRSNETHRETNTSETIRKILATTVNEELNREIYS